MMKSKLLSSSNLKGILGYTNEDLVSTYFLRKSRVVMRLGQSGYKIFLMLPSKWIQRLMDLMQHKWRKRAWWREPT
ncbi:hypothetical protein HanXRQr2_Chr13g0613581 [Helianthus annuus]|uniref:Uncharacterized protein n=1 Tax=Helianthus annuus TaxID=4232 RepID=A0A251SYH6_HELAN|nr:hypothetical protein HanXRQr2_Chr13g0613581 [Helianthus annuus]